MKTIHVIFVTLVLTGLMLLPGKLIADDFMQKRQHMIKEIQQTVTETRDYLDKGQFNSRVMDALARVPRHEFVPDSQLDNAYQNRPLPIGFGQTISQPYIVALMTDLIETKPDFKVLEIGTGSAYQAAVLAELVDSVYSIEVVKELGEQAAERLERLNYNNVYTRIGDGYYGWQEAAPFDAIVVTAASGHVPPPLIKQLKEGGRMVIPVGSRFMTQQLLFVEKALDGSVTTRQVMPVVFVPLTGPHQ
jgi:protein-L-isoaspartate(D-aspartate) O-methyltransferase